MPTIGIINVYRDGMPVAIERTAITIKTDVLELVIKRISGNSISSIVDVGRKLSTDIRVSSSRQNSV